MKLCFTILLLAHLGMVGRRLPWGTPCLFPSMRSCESNRIRCTELRR